ncbi:hypothetical protein [Paenibacillus methanolicus]|uniref:Uncharacterized protein n=1 Tax=Paenibacillus methanolicus TaxID=582686 RepID=A0A5S5C0D2_9BACL|nr:hypothetical protein [Paenibacillus methanolicus]TYP71922.1 hypothetical protein BCM02_109201 [Paenibacillus methanolicus]
MRNKLYVVSWLLLICSLAFNIYCFIEKGDIDKEFASIDHDFKAEIGRIASGISQNDINLAIEHASKADALRKYTSFNDANMANYPAVMVTLLNNLRSTGSLINNKEEIVNLLTELSHQPSHKKNADELLKLMNEN